MISNTENFETVLAPEWKQPNECICCGFDLSDYLKSKNSSLCTSCINGILKENKPVLSFDEENEPIDFDLFCTEKSKRSFERANNYAKYFNTITL